MALPPVPPSFCWSSSPIGDVLECLPLAAIAPHLFTTRAASMWSPAGWDGMAAALGAKRVAMLRQVHGCRVVTLRRESRRSQDRETGDVLVSDDPSTALAVRVADCVPLLVGDPVTGTVAAVHAGWRGTAAGAATAAIDEMRREFGVRPQDLVVAIGPSIGACCYEVGQDVVEAFAAAGYSSDFADRWFSVREGRLVLDVAGANRDQLMLAGIPEDRIFMSGLCTAKHLDVLTSYRAEKEQATRMAAAIRAPHAPRRPLPRSPDDRPPD